MCKIILDLSGTVHLRLSFSLMLIKQLWLVLTWCLPNLVVLPSITRDFEVCLLARWLCFGTYVHKTLTWFL